MGIWQTVALAVGLGADVMSVTAAVGVRWHGRRRALRLALHMGLFQLVMPLIGWWAGRRLAGLLARAGGYLAAALLVGMGVKMLIEALRARPGAAAEAVEHGAERRIRHKADPTRGWSLVGLSLATSVDALVAGFSLALTGHGSIWWVAVVIGAVAAAMALIGVAVGRRIGESLDRAAEIGGALVLIGLGISFLWW